MRSVWSLLLVVVEYSGQAFNSVEFADRSEKAIQTESYLHVWREAVCGRCANTRRTSEDRERSSGSFEEVFVSLPRLHAIQAHSS